MQQYGAGSEGEGRITGQGVSDCVVSADRELQAEASTGRGGGDKRRNNVHNPQEKQTKHHRADS